MLHCGSYYWYISILDFCNFNLLSAKEEIEFNVLGGWSMQSNVNAKPEFQLQVRLSRIAEGILLLGGALTGIWLLAVLILSFIK